MGADSLHVLMTEPTPRPRPARRPEPVAGRRRGWRRAVILGAAGALLLAGCSSPSRHKAAVTTSAPTTTTVPPVDCPLTGEPAPGNAVPARPALAVKVDNYQAARPQTGLDKADMIFEEPVEGGITRYVAVFHCQNASLVGPVRSARNIDIGILTQFGSPLLVHVGGINPVLANIDASPIINVDLGANGQLITTAPGRYAPYATYTSTAAVWALKSSDTTIPAPVFAFSSVVPSGGTPVASVAIPFSSNSNVVWQYDAATKEFLRFYGTTPDMLSTGVQNTAANVIVQTVNVTYGPWLENEEGGLEVQAQLYGTSGPMELFRNGVGITGTWQRAGESSPTVLMNSAGQPLPLQPGQTWIELVPSFVQVTTTSPPAPAVTTTTTTTTTKG